MSHDDYFADFGAEWRMPDARLIFSPTRASEIYAVPHTCRSPSTPCNARFYSDAAAMPFLIPAGISTLRAPCRLAHASSVKRRARTFAGRHTRTSRSRKTPRAMNTSRQSTLRLSHQYAYFFDARRAESVVAAFCAGAARQQARFSFRQVRRAAPRHQAAPFHAD